MNFILPGEIRVQIKDKICDEMMKELEGCPYPETLRSTIRIAVSCAIHACIDAQIERNKSC